MNGLNKVQLLSYLIETLELSNSREEVLDMREWVQFRYESTHFCGYAACICGFVALRTLSDRQPTENDEDYENRIRNEASAVEREITRVIGLDLSDSITGPGEKVRRHRAVASGYFTPEELNHPHLNSDTSLKEAISYMKMLRSKLR